MFSIRQAQKAEYVRVRRFYHTLIDQMSHMQYKPGWEKDVYPSNEYLLDSLCSGALYLGEWEGDPAAAMIVNRQSNEGYQKAAWGVDAAEGEATVIHALGVLPGYSGRGFAKAMVRHAMELAAAQRQKALRLDVLAGNLPAEKLYAGLGFQYRDTVTMFYEDTGWTEFLLFEYPLCQGDHA